MITNIVSVRMRSSYSIAIGIFLLVSSPAAVAQWTQPSGSSNVYKTDTNGNVGIGTTSPGWSLDVSTNQNSLTAVNVGNTTTGTAARAGYLLTTDGHVSGITATNSGYSPSGVYVANGTQLLGEGSGGLAIAARHASGSIRFFSGGSTERMRIDSSGNVGIGTTTPSTVDGFDLSSYKILHFLSSGTTGSRYVVTGGSSASFDLIHSGASVNQKWLNFASISGKAYIRVIDDSGGVPYNFLVGDMSNGNVGIGTTNPQYKLDVAGNINSSATITGNNIVAKYQDVAEWVPSSEKLATGTVVVLDQTKSNQVVASSTAYDTRVAGVISAQPGITLGEKSEDKVLVATTGRVRVMVDATKAPINIGDLLVTSDIPGVAMKSIPVEFAGRKMHLPGTIIGKALEPLAKGKSEIMVLLSLQ